MINLNNLNNQQLNKGSITEPKFTFDLGAFRHAIKLTVSQLKETWCGGYIPKTHKQNKFILIGKGII